MAVSPDYLDHLLDQFAGFGPVEARRMFGGVGIFRGRLMIGLVTDDTLYFKTDDRTRADFEAAGMTPFSFAARGRQMITSYYEAPAEVFEDPEILARWARSAHDVALRADRARGPKTKQKTKAKAKPKLKPKAKAAPKAKPRKAPARPKARAARKPARPAARHR
jgi:DNA transformation protein and related proteins